PAHRAAQAASRRAEPPRRPAVRGGYRCPQPPRAADSRPRPVRQHRIGRTRQRSHRADAGDRAARRAASDEALTAMPPAAISYRINAERIVLVGWLRALLLQIAHPLIAAGVSEHSSFRASTRTRFARLRQTI